MIEQLDEPRAIYDRPLTPFVADFIGDMNFLDGEVVEAADGGFAVDAGSRRGRPRARRTAERGRRVRVGIRPERMAAAPGQPDGTANTAAAEVVTKMYLGDQVQIVATLANGDERGRARAARERRPRPRHHPPGRPDRRQLGRGSPATCSATQTSSEETP